MDMIDAALLACDYMHDRPDDEGVECTLDLAWWIGTITRMCLPSRDTGMFFGVSVEFEPLGGEPKLVSDVQNPEF
jgi:hypothetical protein